MLSLADAEQKHCWKSLILKNKYPIMLVRDLFLESASTILYHYTSIPDALKIVDSGVFELSSVVGTQAEQNYAPPGYPYFLSTTRTRVGDYHRYVGTGAVMLVLDGNWFNQRYRSRAIDYWDRSWLHSGGTRTREAEDRIFSKEPTIPADSIKEVHVLVKEQDEYRSPAARKLLIASKKKGIETYFYTDEKAWRLQVKSKAVDVDKNTPELKGQDPQRGPRHPMRSYLAPWLELIYKKNKGELSREGEKLRHSLVYYGANYRNEDQNLGTDLSNARKPGNHDRKEAIKIIDYMKAHGYKTTVDLKNALVDKWDSLR